MKQSMFDKFTQFAKSPKGQAMIRDVAGKAQQFAKDPKNRQKIEDVRRRFSGGGGGTTRPH
jgi:hypothetical protein